MKDTKILPEEGLETELSGGSPSPSPGKSRPWLIAFPILIAISAVLALAAVLLFVASSKWKTFFICLICLVLIGCLVAVCFLLRHRWHGMIQTLAWAVFAAACTAIFCAVHQGLMKIHYAWLLGGVFLAVTVAITCSHAYNYQKGLQGGGPLCEQAAKKRATWLHANHCWQILNVSMTIIPLYCTCAAIYLSGNQVADSMNDILIYSILSLVISLGTYVIRPSNRAAGYRRAYTLVDEALTNLEYSELGRQSVAEALTKGNQIVADQDILDPK